MTSSPESRVLRAETGALAPMRTPELREGVWTRFGGAHVRGDVSTETVLDELAERTRAAARSQGYAVGWTDGRRDAAAAARSEAEAVAARAAAGRRAEEELAAALTALRAAAARFDAATAAAREEIEQQASTLALTLTEELVGHALSEESPADVVRRVTRALPTEGRAVVRLHPTVAASLAAAELAGSDVTVRADASVQPYDAVVELDDRLVSLDAAAALQRLRAVLG